jgi:O-antigen/teichoic acid export membrane protein
MPSNTARIAKNTLMLYFRQMVTMLLNFYTVRVILNALGAENYGIYNVVAGIVVMFSFLNGAMTSATQRFLNYVLGRNDIEQARDIFSISFVIHGMIALCILLLSETIGLWFFCTQLNIPLERRYAASVVYQISIATTGINIIRVPYNAAVIAHEKMSFLAMTGIIENILKFIAAFLLTVILYDSLIVYAFFIGIIGIIMFLIYKFYCNRNFEMANFRYCNNTDIYRKLIRFSGWSIFGGIANVSSSHGVNVLINMFSTVTVNAAMGIATQINAAVYQFVGNFQSAFNPQIIKSYSRKEYDYFMRLIFKTSKFSFILLFFFALPLYINIEFVLKVWLKNIPDYTIIFARLILIFSLIDALSGPLWMSVQATGNIKKYQLMVSCLIFANLPLSFLFLWLGYSPVCVLIIKVVLNAATHIWRMFFLQKHISLSATGFLYEVIIPIMIISGVSASVTIYVFKQFSGLKSLVYSGSISVICTAFLTYLVGINQHEKIVLKNTALKMLNGLKTHRK